MNNLKEQIHYVFGYLMIGSLLVTVISYLSHNIQEEFLLLLIISVVVYIFTEKGGDKWMT